MDMPPEVRIGIISGVVVVGIAVLLLVFGDRPELAAAIRRLLAGRASVMSSGNENGTSGDRSANQSLDQSAPTSLDAQTSAPAHGGLDSDLPGMEWSNPPASRYLTDDEFIIFLAMQKLRNGKYRMSANDIVKAAHGDRTQVLKIIRQVREGTPEYPPLAPEGAEVRAQLQLD